MSNKLIYIIVSKMSWFAEGETVGQKLHRITDEIIQVDLAREKSVIEKIGREICGKLVETLEGSAKEKLTSCRLYLDDWVYSSGIKIPSNFPYFTVFETITAQLKSQSVTLKAVSSETGDPITPDFDKNASASYIDLIISW